jgi:hypothetical protein
MPGPVSSGTPYNLTTCTAYCRSSKLVAPYNGHSLQPKHVGAAKLLVIVQWVGNKLACITQLHGTCTILNSFMQTIHTADVIRYKSLCRRLTCIAFISCNYERAATHSIARQPLHSFISLEGYSQNQNLTKYSHHESEISLLNKCYWHNVTLYMPGVEYCTHHITACLLHNSNCHLA